MKPPETANRPSPNTPEASPGFAAEVEHYLDDQAVAQAAARRGRPRTSLPERLKSYPPPQEELDLHGLTSEEAERAVRRFVGHCRRLQLATLRIITGKGLHSPSQPVLPPLAEATLADLVREKRVLAFRWEKGRQGRQSGSLIVYLPRGR